MFFDAFSTPSFNQIPFDIKTGKADRHQSGIIFKSDDITTDRTD